MKIYRVDLFESNVLNVKPLTGLFKANMHYAPIALVFQCHFTIVILNSELHSAITICNAPFGMRSDASFTTVAIA